MPGGFGSPRIVIALLLGVLLIWLATGFYRVQPDQQGVALVFGKWRETTSPGLHWNWPAPIGDVVTPRVTQVNRVEVGYRSGSASARTQTTRDIPQESLMLTGDENIIDIQFTVQWRIADAGKFLYNVRNPEQTVKDAAESAMREVLGKNQFEFARTSGRGEVQAQARELLQQILDKYATGIAISQLQYQKVDPPAQVIDAFRDVQAARADKERAVNEAQAYRNEVVQRAEGQAEQLVRNAEAYKEEKIAIATGDAQRFLSVYNEYLNNSEVTTRRIYLETMEQVLGQMDKVLIERDTGGTGVVPYLPLNELRKGRPQTQTGDVR